MSLQRPLPDFGVVDLSMAAVLRGKTGAERLRIAWGLRESARRMLLAHLRVKHADWSEEQVLVEVARRFSHATG